MEIVLLERVEKLGQMGQVVNVRPGYARNYLLPQKKALRATKANLAFFETQKAELQARNLERRKEAEQVSEKMKGLVVIITRQAAESGMLYGSVNGRDISDAVTAEGFVIERNQVAINDPIKSLGLFDVRVILHPEVSVNVKVNVARSLEEAQMQAQRGGMVTAADLLAEEEEAEAAAAAASAEEEEEDTEA
ncbi:large subunit ribosomal protein L9 [Skermanella aerolata]|jgi:large subunit ribosomal protein L9|uniref:Large ribosomal subunit protein bL9 n=1 Tax=Skermanella aerolata TaxID=393310 RepID=A0A512DHU9_9PROT|nr:50S ribosomal protein L9 [Skermanella aerolata]KJB97661.1 50S ribosomal protein L9 [Skermanella aerolata KACC 11604]GEO36069.1 50S ribosomal protein L9 [Skermanella aerolata]